MRHEFTTPSWPEAVEQDERLHVGKGAIPFPTFNELLREATEMRMKTGTFELGAGPHRRKFGTVPEVIPASKFDIHNIFCFQALPSVVKMKTQVAERVANKMFMWAVNQGKSPEEAVLVAGEYAEQSFNEMAHQIFHHVMWRHYGKRVYALDPTTYNLLALTELPKLPASMLAAPLPSFYLRFPRGAFNFTVYNPIRDAFESQPIEGVMVGMDNIDPDSEKPRELALIATGENVKVDERNIAYISLGLGPDARLSDIKIEPRGMEADAKYGMTFTSLSQHELGVILPRVVLGFLLYLQSEHPDIEPVPPAPRRNFKEIRSPKQRETALRNQEAKLKKLTRLPLLYIGRRLAEDVEREEKRRTPAPLGKTWSLDHQVWVPGHWKRQAYGEGRVYRKTIWIRPYTKGPDTAEALKATARKVQQAQHK